MSTSVKVLLFFTLISPLEFAACLALIKSVLDMTLHRLFSHCVF